MSMQIIALKDRTDLQESSPFWLWRLFAFELRRWGYALGEERDLCRTIQQLFQVGDLKRPITGTG